MSNFTLVELPTFASTKGSLTVFEDSMPFLIKRVYWIYEAENFIRGGHRHKVTRQALIAIAGEVEIYISDGIREDNIKLNNPKIALIVEPEDWHTMKFSKDSILLVMASTLYSKDDYIDQSY